MVKIIFIIIMHKATGCRVYVGVCLCVKNAMTL